MHTYITQYRKYSMHVTVHTYMHRHTYQKCTCIHIHFHMQKLMLTPILHILTFIISSMTMCIRWVTVIVCMCVCRFLYTAKVSGRESCLYCLSDYKAHCTLFTVFSIWICCILLYNICVYWWWKTCSDLYSKFYSS